MKFVDRGTQFTERMSVNGTGATGEIVLTISNVQPVDEVEFICLIKGLTDGTGEGRTKLKVFGKISSKKKENTLKLFLLPHFIDNLCITMFTKSPPLAQCHNL